jgi:hypothetical protein
MTVDPDLAADRRLALLVVRAALIACTELAESDPDALVSRPAAQAVDWLQELVDVTTPDWP